MDLFSDPERAVPVPRGAAAAPALDPFAPPASRPRPDGEGQGADPAVHRFTAQL